MAKFRNLSTTGDWEFGRGVQSYAQDLAALKLDIKTRILSWVGDCFFSMTDFIDWKNLMNYGMTAQLKLALKEVAFRTNGVMRVNSIDVAMSGRTATIQISVDTIFGSNVSNAITLAGA